jgi:carboxymethylenebutenolidase
LNLEEECAARMGKGGKLMTHQDRIQEIDAVFGDHMDAELAGDLDTTMATMSADPHLVNVPTMIGGCGQEGVRGFYSKRLIGQFFPPDVEFTSVTKTYSDDRMVDEMVITFTHTEKIDWMLPGVEPTGRSVSVAFVVIVGLDGDKVHYEHIHWDQANVLVQIGLLDPKGLPVVGAGATAKLVDPSIPDPFFHES